MSSTAKTGRSSRIRADSVSLNDIVRGAAHVDASKRKGTDDVARAGDSTANDVAAAVLLDQNSGTTGQTRRACGTYSNVISLHNIIITKFEIDGVGGAAKNVARCRGRAADGVTGTGFRSDRGAGCHCRCPGGINSDKIALNKVVAAAVLKANREKDADLVVVDDQPAHG